VHSIPLLIPICVLAVAIVALMVMVPKGAPATPAFARRATQPAAGQLRQDPNAHIFWDRGGSLFGRRAWFEGTCCPPVQLRLKEFTVLEATHQDRPARITQANGRTWWWLGDSYYWETAGYSDQDVLALIRSRERKSQQKLDRARMLLNAEHEPRQGRLAISREMKRAVYARDGGRCQQCGATFDIQYDHIIPVALGGATSIENLQILCGQCNLDKGADL